MGSSRVRRRSTTAWPAASLAGAGRQPRQSPGGARGGPVGLLKPAGGSLPQEAAAGGDHGRPRVPPSTLQLFLELVAVVVLEAGLQLGVFVGGFLQVAAAGILSLVAVGCPETSAIGGTFLRGALREPEDSTDGQVACGAGETGAFEGTFLRDLRMSSARGPPGAPSFAHLSGEQDPKQENSEEDQHFAALSAGETGALAGTFLRGIHEPPAPGTSEVLSFAIKGAEQGTEQENQHLEALSARETSAFAGTFLRGIYESPAPGPSEVLNFAIEETIEEAELSFAVEEVVQEAKQQANVNLKDEQRVIWADLAAGDDIDSDGSGFSLGPWQHGRVEADGRLALPTRKRAKRALRRARQRARQQKQPSASSTAA